MTKYKMEILLIVVGVSLTVSGVYLAYTKNTAASAVPAVVAENNTPKPAPVAAPLSNKEKGDAFENYIVSLFDTVSGRFKLIEWRSDKIADNGMYAQSNKHPDLQFEFNGDNRVYRFAIECKWRSKFIDGAIEWAYPAQIQNYLEYEKKSRTKVFVAIGVGGTSSMPDKLYMVPLSAISNHPKHYETYLKHFARKPTHRFFFRQHDQMLE